MLIYNARILAEDGVIERGWLRIDGEQIDAVSDTPPPDDSPRIDAGGRTLAPGFIDIHVHGGGGHEAMDATPEALRGLSAFYARHGVTGFLATTWTAADTAILNALQTVADVMADPAALNGADLLGAHVEGPYINENKSGAQPDGYIRRADRAEFDAWRATGVIRRVTIAPEFEANQALAADCAKRGISVSAGHTDATFTQMQEAVARGVDSTTHTFNAMRGLHHREPGTVGAALLLSQLRCEVIADGVHLHPAIVDLLWRVKGADGLIMITDAVRGAGLAEGTIYQQDGRRVTVRDGSAYLDDGTLAGSTLTMSAAVQNVARFTACDFAQLWPCFSRTPARVIGVDDITGSIATGKRADLVLLDDALNVTQTIVKGRVVYDVAID
ncbi:MAG: N-acetylglucosamine-6-phosphate deacetylase [Anaerolineaceae bacterium]|nr:MAG: N-acetylglucosamine-6-phosphate deacetylase [Anaerolineaceae bacterium]